MDRYPEYIDSGVEWIGEIPSHWKDLVADCCESVTDAKFELANIWASNEEEENSTSDTDDPSLALSRSFDPVTSEENEPTQPSEGESNPEGASDPEGEPSPPLTPSDSSLLMPDMTDLDSISLRRSTRKRTPSRRALAQ